MQPFGDSFDHYATANITEKWTSHGNCTIGAFGRNGTNGLRISAAGFNGSIQKTVAPGGTAGGCGFSVKVNALYNSNPDDPFIDIRGADATFHLNVLLKSTGLFEIRRGHSGTILGTSTLGIAANIASYIEFKWNIHDTTGSFELRINGDVAIAVSGVDTRNGTNAGWTSILMYNGSNNAGLTQDYDDFVLWDTTDANVNDFLGDVQVRAHFSNASGVSTAWTRGGADSGSNFGQVDEASQNGDTDYVLASGIGTADYYEFENLKTPGQQILFVLSTHQAKKVEAGTAGLGTTFRHSGTNYPPASGSTLGLVYSNIQRYHPVNPGTGAAWIEADFNAIQAGPYKTA